MPHVTHRGHKIHYEVQGSGPTLVLQHGMFGSAAQWREQGFTNEFAKRFNVVSIDSLAHGESDIPLSAPPYAQAERAGDVVAVLEAVGADRAHFLGYSMGGWIAVGMAKYYPERLASLTVGGWDAINGTATAAAAAAAEAAIDLETLTFDMLFAGLRQLAPDMAEQVTPEVEPAFRACFEALSDLDGAAQAVCGLSVPVLLWNGRDDPYHDPMQSFADANGFEFLSTGGDHLGAMLEHGGDAARTISNILLEKVPT